VVQHASARIKTSVQKKLPQLSHLPVSHPKVNLIFSIGPTDIAPISANQAGSIVKSKKHIELSEQFI
jgi:hypothetical protein